MYILGLSAYYHDSAACLIKDGRIVSAAQEERFTRVKHDSRFPSKAAEYCLAEAGIGLDSVTDVVFYDKPLLKFDRILETYFSIAPRGYRSFAMAMPIWIRDKLFLKSIIKDELCKLPGGNKKNLPKVFFTEHHQSHAASAFFPSPFEKAAILTIDGVGEWATTSAWIGDGNSMTSLWQIDFPHSLGLLYSAFTYFCGFKVNSGEYKLMGLAPYGEPLYVDLIKKNLIDIKSDGSFRLNMDYFDFLTGLKMTGKKFAQLFEMDARESESALTQKHMDIAASIQAITEEIMLKLAQSLHAETGLENLCLAGGVALNCVANGKILKQGPFKNIWIQPAAGDAGGSLGAALAKWYQYNQQPRKVEPTDSMQGAYLGPHFGKAEIEKRLKACGAIFSEMNETEMLSHVAQSLEQGKVIGWFQGRMEFGPRSLGARSIIGDARNEKMQSVLNLKIKFRESFRPFAPAVLSEDVDKYFDLKESSPYMLLVANVQKNRQITMSAQQKSLFGIEKLNIPRSDIPAVTHIDYSARIQTVHEETNPKFHKLIEAFKAKTGNSVLVNTSFNVRGEPIVCTPEDAYVCFMRTEMDELIIENFILKKSAQPKITNDQSWKKDFQLD